MSRRNSASSQTSWWQPSACWLVFVGYYANRRMTLRHGARVIREHVPANGEAADDVNLTRICEFTRPPASAPPAWGRGRHRPRVQRGVPRDMGLHPRRLHARRFAARHRKTAPASRAGGHPHGQERAIIPVPCPTSLIHSCRTALAMAACGAPPARAAATVKDRPHLQLCRRQAHRRSLKWRWYLQLGRLVAE
jgi:hypothetical protein